MTDSSKLLQVNGKTLYQIGFEALPADSTKVYGIQQAADGKMSVKLVEVDAAGTIDIATTEKAGIVKPDGISIGVEEDGTISVTDAYGASFSPKLPIATLLSVLKENNTITENDYDVIYAELYPESVENNG